jgi:hypothetical protein
MLVGHAARIPPRRFGERPAPVLRFKFGEFPECG